MAEVLEFTQEETQIIWDALCRYQYELYKLSQSDHFAKDDFAKIHNACVNLIKQIDEKWAIIH